MQRDLPVPTSVWSYSWNGNTEAVEWTEIAVVHASAKYLWAFGYRYSKQRRKGFKDAH